MKKKMSTYSKILVFSLSFPPPPLSLAQYHCFDFFEKIHTVQIFDQNMCPCVFVACSASSILEANTSPLPSNNLDDFPRKCLTKSISSVRNCLRVGKGASLANMAVTLSSLLSTSSDRSSVL